MWAFSSSTCFHQKILILSSRNILQNTLLSTPPWSQSQEFHGSLVGRPHGAPKCKANLVVEIHLQPGQFLGVTQKDLGSCFENTVSSSVAGKRHVTHSQGFWFPSCGALSQENPAEKAPCCPQLPDHSFVWASCSLLLFSLRVSHCRTGSLSEPAGLFIWNADFCYA